MTNKAVMNVGHEPNTLCHQKNGPKLGQVNYTHAISKNLIKTLLKRKIIQLLSRRWNII